MIQNQQLKLT